LPFLIHWVVFPIDGPAIFTDRSVIATPQRRIGFSVALAAQALKFTTEEGPIIASVRHHVMRRVGNFHDAFCQTALA
jgi:hypothetical protein